MFFVFSSGRRHGRPHGCRKKSNGFEHFAFVPHSGSLALRSIVLRLFCVVVCFSPQKKVNGEAKQYTHNTHISWLSLREELAVLFLHHHRRG